LDDLRAATVVAGAAFSTAVNEENSRTFDRKHNILSAFSAYYPTTKNDKLEGFMSTPYQLEIL